MLRIADDLTLPPEAVTQTFGILAKRRVGKTYTASVMAEEFCKAKLPFVALDPTGAWWGLRSSADGKREGYPVIILGGEHGDVPLEASVGKVVADLVVDHPGFYVIDLSATQSNAEQDRFVTDFAERLYRRKAQHKHPLHLFVDEADSFAPQRPLPGQQRMLGAIEAIVRRGGIRGLGATLITQRPAVLNKNVLTQIEVLVILQITAPQDRAAIDEWVRGNGTKEQRDELVASLASLGKGDAWFWSPAWLDVFKRVHVRRRETFNSSATPEVGKSAGEPRRLAPVDLEALRSQMAATLERAKETDPKELQRRIAELQRQALKQSQPAATRVEIQRVEVPVITQSDIARFEKIGREINEAIKEFQAAADQLSRNLQARLAAFHKSSPSSRALPVSPARIPRPAPTPARVEMDSTAALPKAERSILTVLAQYPNGKSVREIAVIAGYAWKGGGFNNALSYLRKRELVAGSKERYQITDAGLAALGEWEPLPTGQALIDYWMRQLPKAERASLTVLVNHYPDSLDRESLAAEAGYKADGGGFNNAVSKLRTLELIEGRQELKASDILFTPDPSPP